MIHYHLLSLFTFDFSENVYSGGKESLSFGILLYKALIAAIPSLVVFGIGYWLTKRKEELKEQRTYQSTIANISTHVDAIAIRLGKFVTKYNEFLNKQNEDPFISPGNNLYPLVTLPDLKSLILLQKERAFDAFFFYSNKSNNTDLYRRVFNDVIYLNETIELLDSVHNTLSEESYKMQEDFQKLYSDILKELSRVLNSPENESISKIFLPIMTQYSATLETENPTIPQIYQHLLIPINVGIIQLNAVDRIFDVAVLVRDAIFLHNKIKDKSIEEVTALGRLVKSLERINARWVDFNKELSAIAPPKTIKKGHPAKSGL